MTALLTGRARNMGGAAWRRRLVRLPLILLCLLSLGVQSHLTQTHIHVPQERHLSGHGETGKRPAGDGADCFLCHQIAAAGAYLPSAPMAYLVPRVVHAFAPDTAETPAAVQPVSHAWRGRGPPTF